MIELTDEQRDRIARRNGPVHAKFGLTYASYLVLPRSLMQEMPLGWQERFVQLIDEYWEVWDCMKADKDYTVQARDEHGRFVSDPLCNYRRPPHDLIESLRLKQ